MLSYACSMISRNKKSVDPIHVDKPTREPRSHAIRKCSTAWETSQMIASTSNCRFDLQLHNMTILNALVRRDISLRCSMNRFFTQTTSEQARVTTHQNSSSYASTK